MLKVLHGADFHLDSPFSGLKPDAAARRRGEQRELLARLTDLAREREADLVLLSGDLLDGDLVFRETVQVLARALGEIPCPVFLAPGNHDCYSPSSVYATLDWPDNVHIFTSPAVEGVDLPQLPLVLSAAQWLEEQAVADGAFALALGLPLHLGVPPFMTGSKLVTKVLTEDMADLTGGRIIVDPNGRSAADKLEAIIEEKRRALNI